MLFVPTCLVLLIAPLAYVYLVVDCKLSLWCIWYQVVSVGSLGAAEGGGGLVLVEVATYKQHGHHRKIIDVRIGLPS